MAKGYRRIAFIGGTSNRDTRGADRQRGYAQAIRELGLPDGRVISFGQPPISMAQGGEAVAQLIRQWPDVDAVLCVSDLSAFGALMECQRRGWNVPGPHRDRGLRRLRGGARLPSAHHHRGGGLRGPGQGRRRAAAARDGRRREGHRPPPETVMIPFHIEQRESS
jgi:LacI family gluconate utilization system Gnt-I transcriptional repressor